MTYRKNSVAQHNQHPAATIPHGMPKTSILAPPLLMTVDVSTLYYGDNLDVLREHIPSESVDLVYLDPPFNSARDYNVLFTEHDVESEAQIHAFEDTWRWDTKAEATYREITGEKSEALGISPRLVTLVEAMRSVLGTNDMMAYLVMIAARLVELRRVLKPTGSLYLHCDPTASHYLKLVLDAVFGVEHFINEIVWLRTVPKGLMSTRLANNHDVILAYSKGDEWQWNEDAGFQAYDADNLDEKTDEKYSLRDPDGRRYQLTSLLNPAHDRPNLTYPFLGVTRVWRWTPERMEAAYKAGIVVQPSEGAVPRLKRYLDEQRGKPLGDVWIDIPPLNAQADERLGYPTQKPVALLERILRLATKPGDVVLDPFCGCGTTIDAAQRLNREWIGIDITHLAIALIRNRLNGAFPGLAYEVRGEPVDINGARELADSDPYQFQWWALHLVGARPVGDATGREGKKGADRGIDGVIRFKLHPSDAASERIVVSVKAGKNIGPSMVRDLRGVVQREKAAMGVLLTMRPPTAEMRAEAVAAGVWKKPPWREEFPVIQIITIEQAFAGKGVAYPGQRTTLQSTPPAPPPSLPGLGGPPTAPKKGRRK